MASPSAHLVLVFITPAPVPTFVAAANAALRDVIAGFLEDCTNEHTQSVSIQGTLVFARRYRPNAAK